MRDEEGFAWQMTSKWNTSHSGMIIQSSHLSDGSLLRLVIDDILMSECSLPSTCTAIWHRLLVQPRGVYPLAPPGPSAAVCWCVLRLLSGSLTGNNINISTRQQSSWQGFYFPTIHRAPSLTHTHFFCECCAFCPVSYLSFYHRFCFTSWLAALLPGMIWQTDSWTNAKLL